MKQSFLTVKLHELELQQSRLQTGIRRCQKESIEELKKEIREIEDECETEDLLLEQSVKEARSKAVSKLAEAQLSYDRKLAEIVETTLQDSIKGNETLKESKTEANMLYAEYCIDFAIRASKQALRAAMTAVKTGLEWEEWRKEHA